MPGAVPRNFKDRSRQGSKPGRRGDQARNSGNPLAGSPRRPGSNPVVAVIQRFFLRPPFLRPPFLRPPPFFRPPFFFFLPLFLPPFRPPFLKDAFLVFLPRPLPDFFPPPLDLFTVAQARRSASSSLVPRSLYPSSICSAWR